MELSLIGLEANAGVFSADLVAETASGATIIIENQLERTDHDHLGKLITYLSNLEAKAAFWITSEPRPEHEQAIHWLNEMLPADTAFYLIRIEAYRIGDSPAAPLFTVVAGPSAEARHLGEKKKELASQYVKGAVNDAKNSDHRAQSFPDGNLWRGDTLQHASLQAWVF